MCSNESRTYVFFVVDGSKIYTQELCLLKFPLPMVGFSPINEFDL